MPRLPAVRVIGSQAISLTMTFCFGGVSIAICLSPHSAFGRKTIRNSRFTNKAARRSPPLRVARGERLAASTPFGFLVVLGRDVPMTEVADHRSIRVFHDGRCCTAPLV